MPLLPGKGSTSSRRSLSRALAPASHRIWHLNQMVTALYLDSLWGNSLLTKLIASCLTLQLLQDPRLWQGTSSKSLNLSHVSALVVYPSRKTCSSQSEFRILSMSTMGSNCSIRSPLNVSKRSGLGPCLPSRWCACRRRYSERWHTLGRCIGPRGYSLSTMKNEMAVLWSGLSLIRFASL